MEFADPHQTASDEPVVAGQADRSASICARIAFHASIAPQRLAVADEHGQLTYEELDQRSSQLAGYLLEAGRRPNVAWDCCWIVRCSLWWRRWRCSKPARLTCRWIRPRSGSRGVHFVRCGGAPAAQPARQGERSAVRLVACDRARWSRSDRYCLAERRADRF